jgi:putative nucleotidyltransferase with HDIG domain
VTPTRSEAWALLTQHTEGASLLKHALGVEAAMRAYAPRFGADADLWGIVGLLHDLDYEKHPSLEEHPFVGAAILREHGYSEDIVASVLGHADHTGVARETPMAKTLYAVDELVGFIVAVALVRPSKSITDLPVKSVMKKFKDKAFCRAIEREHLRAGADDLGVEMREHVGTIIGALAGISDELGLA